MNKSNNTRDKSRTKPLVKQQDSISYLHCTIFKTNIFKALSAISSPFPPLPLPSLPLLLFPFSPYIAISTIKVILYQVGVGGGGGGDIWNCCYSLKIGCHNHFVDDCKLLPIEYGLIIVTGSSIPQQTYPYYSYIVFCVRRAVAST